MDVDKIHFYNNIHVVDRYGKIDEGEYWRVYFFAKSKLIDEIITWCYNNVRFNIHDATHDATHREALNGSLHRIGIKLYSIEDLTLFELTWL